MSQDRFLPLLHDEPPLPNSRQSQRKTATRLLKIPLKLRAYTSKTFNNIILIGTMMAVASEGQTCLPHSVHFLLMSVASFHRSSANATELGIHVPIVELLTLSCFLVKGRREL